MNDLQKKIFEKIEEKNIVPKGRWYFQLKNIGLLIFSFFFVVVGSLAMAIIFYMVKSSDYDLYEKAGGGFGNFILASLPYFWLLILAGGVIVAYYVFHRTKKAYRYRMIYLVISAVIINIILGALVYSSGLGEKLENRLADGMPLYDRYLCPHKMLWQQPARGLLMGQVVDIRDDRIFMITDLGYKSWLINDLREKDIFDIIIGQHLRMMGKIRSENEFDAQLIHLHRMPRPGFQPVAPCGSERNSCEMRIIR